jgi:hypothetical protein
MPFDKRRAYIEFKNKNTVHIVTALKDKEFTLSGKGCTIDLINLSKTDVIYDSTSNFFAVFVYDKDRGLYRATVHMRSSEDNIEEIGCVDIHNNKQAYHGNVWASK